MLHYTRNKNIYKPRAAIATVENKIFIEMGLKNINISL